MSFADLGTWGENVPEYVEIAALGTEAVQGSSTPPILPTATQTPTEPPTATPTDTVEPSPTVEPSATNTTPPDEPTATPVTPTNTPVPSSTPAPSFTPVPSPTLPTFRPTVTPPPFTPIPAAPVIGQHVVQSGETIFCIGRGYGVLPGAIAQANNLPATFNVRTGQILNIPQVQWVNISPGHVCATQFASPFPGLPVPTATSAASNTPAAPPLVVSLNWNCVDNCGSDQGSYTVRVEVFVSGGLEPYTYNPPQTHDVVVPHCTDGQGSATVTSADGQVASAAWFYDDVSCNS
jgi:LysM repeat protein